MSHVLSRAFAGDLAIRSDGRTVLGIAVPWHTPTRVSDDGRRSYMEAFAPGSFARTIAERGDRVKFLALHATGTMPLGRATLLREDAAGLYAELRVSKTAAGDEALELIRDGALDGLSIGFTPVRHRRDGDVTVRTEVGLREISAVTFPAYDGARIAAVRSADIPNLLIAQAKLALARARS
jgi:HK97 family phage prohead protease